MVSIPCGVNVTVTVRGGILECKIPSSVLEEDTTFIGSHLLLLKHSRILHYTYNNSKDRAKLKVIKLQFIVREVSLQWDGHKVLKTAVVEESNESRRRLIWAERWTTNVN